MKSVISIAQFNISPAKVSTNLEKVRNFVIEAAKRSATLLILPELFTSGYELNDLESVAQENLRAISICTSMATKLQIYIAGSMVEKVKSHYFNTMYLFSPQGKTITRYRKIHLFSPLKEDQFFLPGNNLSSAETPWGKTGFAICYDLRFPEMFIVYRKHSIDSIIVSAEWPKSRISHWKTLLAARAIETQTFIFASNSVGKTLDHTYGGYSIIIDPWGNILAKGSANHEELISAIVDFSVVKNVREEYPFFIDRQPDKYILH